MEVKMNFYEIDWGYIMDIAIASIVGALIAVAGSIVVNWLGNRKGYKDIDSKIGTLNNTTLSGEHSKITEDITTIINDKAKNINYKIGVLDNTTLSGQNKEIIDKINTLSQNLQKDKDLEYLKERTLDSEMLNIQYSIKNLSEFSNIMKELSYENSVLKKENYQLKNQNKKLQNELNHLKEQNKSILPNKISTQDFGMHL
jgi:hypothetical protein